MIRLPIDAAFGAARFTRIEGPSPVLEGGILRVGAELLEKLAETAFRELAFYFRKSQLEALLELRDSPGASENDRLVAAVLLRNAVVAAGGDLASCQDTGTAVIYGWKDEGVHTGADDGEALETGTALAYRNNHLRASQTGARSFFGEFNTGDNLPAQIQLAAVPGSPEEGPRYRFLFTAKGGGSSNKTAFFPLTPALLEEGAFRAFLEERIPALGTAACPPYHLAVAVGGTSPEQNLEILKLATTGFLDGLPFFGEEGGGREDAGGGSLVHRDRFWEGEAMRIGRECGLGAQFGGTGLLLSARVIRLPRHAASCPVSIGVSCAAHRSLLACISREGLFVEELVHDPAGLLRESARRTGTRKTASSRVEASGGHFRRQAESRIRSSAWTGPWGKSAGTCRPFRRGTAASFRENSSWPGTGPTLTGDASSRRAGPCRTIFSSIPFITRAPRRPPPEGSREA